MLHCCVCVLLLSAAFLLCEVSGLCDIIRQGNPQDVTPQLSGPAFYLEGDGSPVASTFQTHVQQLLGSSAQSQSLDIVVLSAIFPTWPFDSLTPECDKLWNLTGVNSCTTVTLTNAEDALNSKAANMVLQAETVYFSGGDQCDYVRWLGSPTIDAVLSTVWQKNGGCGGGSAGLAIQGQYVYDSCLGGVDSAEALANPYFYEVTFTYNFFNWSSLHQVITDTHFQQRDRMGRLMVFVARQLQDGLSKTVYGLGINEGVTCLMSPDGVGTAHGGPFFVVMGDHAPDTCTKGTPLTYTNYKLWKVSEGESFDFNNKPTTGYYTRSVADGVITGGDPYNP